MVTRALPTASGDLIKVRWPTEPGTQMWPAYAGTSLNRPGLSIFLNQSDPNLVGPVQSKFRVYLRPLIAPIHAKFNTLLFFNIPDHWLDHFDDHKEPNKAFIYALETKSITFNYFLCIEYLIIGLWDKHTLNELGNTRQSQETTYKISSISFHFIFFGRKSRRDPLHHTNRTKVVIMQTNFII